MQLSLKFVYLHKFCLHGWSQYCGTLRVLVQVQFAISKMELNI